MKATKKLVSLALSLALLFSCSSATFATASDLSSAYITIEDCKNAGEKWITANCPEGTIIASIIPIRDLDDQLNAYCISFTNNDEPAGYLVLNAPKNCNSYIREFSVDGVGIYEQLASKIQTRSSIESVIYATAPFEYAIKYTIDDEDLYYNSNSTVLTIEEEQSLFGGIELYSDVETFSNDKAEYYEAFFYGSDLSGYTTKSYKNVTGATVYIPYTMAELRTGKNVGNCSVTALTNICGYYYKQGLKNILKNGSITDTYNELVAATNFDIDGSYGVSYQTATKALTAYVESRSCKITTDRYMWDLWSDFKRDFDKDKLNLITVSGEKIENGNWVTTAHQVVGIGYKILSDDTRYIRVYDGWNDTSSRFISFDSDLLTLFYGTSIVIS